MPDVAPSDAQATSESQATEPSHLPARTDDLREQLPGLEPDRRLTDWGRSERIEGILDRLVLHPLYHYWLRAEVEGVENLPETGGALLVANHAGTLPLDAVMIAKAVREDHPRARAVHLSAAPRLTGIPGVGMALTKVGGIAAHPANLHRLLYDEGELVLAFPEGRAGPAKPLGRRYLLRRFDSALPAVAARAGVPIVPVAVLGAEEATPVLGRVRGRLLGRWPGVPLALPLPAKFRLRFLEPVQPDPGELDPGSLAALASDLRALIQENLFEMLGARRNVWLG
ncbi:MAG TPA: 1-acyl-sn-glycerol-3-phosphate acyltransferase [Solirubrobacteraceae bacterium]|nr:1-acyl-sn-glycerol-3-phosphate acyltransferase [Solirubrobacteraceae bacterium]